MKESDLKKGVVRQSLEGIGLLDNKTRASQTKDISAEVRHDLMDPPEVRADLMKASGQVGKIMSLNNRSKQALSSAYLQKLLGVRSRPLSLRSLRLLQRKCCSMRSCLALLDL